MNCNTVYPAYWYPIFLFYEIIIYTFLLFANKMHKVLPILNIYLVPFGLSHFSVHHACFHNLFHRYCTNYAKHRLVWIFNLYFTFFSRLYRIFINFWSSKIAGIIQSACYYRDLPYILYSPFFLFTSYLRYRIKIIGLLKLCFIFHSLSWLLYFHIISPGSQERRLKCQLFYICVPHFIPLASHPYPRYSCTWHANTRSSADAKRPLCDQ